MAKRFNEEYWIACKEQNVKQNFRVKAYGRSVQINGRLYFESRDHIFTDAYTGCCIPKRYHPSELPVDLMEREGLRLGSVMDLPLREQLELDIDTKKILDNVLNKSNSQMFANLEGKGYEIS